MNTYQQAFLSPVTPFHSCNSLTRLASTRCPSRHISYYRACLPPESDEERRPFQIKTPLQNRNNPSSKNDVIDETEATFSELDELAEEWIGANLSRWEWYEKLKSRRQKMLCEVRKREEELNNEFEELRRTFMEFDAMFGTSMLDEQSSISPTGWGIVALIMFGYVAFGYWIVELVVKAFTDYSPGFPL